jgi:polyisoprenoid-binding protein YceI
MLILIFIFFTSSAQAGPMAYQLEKARSKVQFTYEFGGNTMTGRMPVQSADMSIDLDNLPASSIRVTLDAAHARAGFVFATQAMKSASALNTDKFPEIVFKSTHITGDLKGAVVTGDLTVRGVTLPVTLMAGLYRQGGTDVGDRNNLAILLTGDINRSAYGAGGYRAYVGDTIHLRIIALISK